MNEYELLAQAKNFFVDLWNTIDDFFTSYKFQEIVFTLKFIFILISFILFVLIVLLILKIIVSSFTKRKNIFKADSLNPDFNIKKIEKKWLKIENKIKSGVEANYKLAILEAEKVFDSILKEFGYDFKKKLSNVDDLKAADKLKNDIIEDKKLEISKEQAEAIVGFYKKGIEELLS